MQHLILIIQVFNRFLVLLLVYLIKKEECFPNARYSRTDIDHQPQACTTNHHLTARLVKNLG